MKISLAKKDYLNKILKLQYLAYKSETNLYLYNKLNYKKYKEEKLNEKITLIFLRKILRI